ncbi:MAG TPA: Rrf2 family transcriptional regulator [Bryobacteraceae bacterium]|jgi:Rrf2 family nitric oxide-sensitive transcriptional repressor|nr:Rrf2 family transcriptional regulator [Bryobacteraceae bacterium]
MQLTLHSEYALRVLLYLGTQPGRLCSTREISTAYGISRNHLVRVVQTLGDHGYLELVPGRGGGISLGKEPRPIRLGEAVRHSEPNMRLAECFDRQTNRCVLTPVCSLKPVLNEALDAFVASLNRYTLADLLAGGARQKLSAKFAILTL